MGSPAGQCCTAKTRAEAARRLCTALVARDDALKSRVAKEIVDDSSAVRQEGAHPPRPRGRLGAASAARTSVQSSGAGSRRLRVGRDQTDQRQAHSRVSNRDSMVLNASVIPMEGSRVISWR